MKNRRFRMFERFTSLNTVLSAPRGSWGCTVESGAEQNVLRTCSKSCLDIAARSGGLGDNRQCAIRSIIGGKSSRTRPPPGTLRIARSPKHVVAYCKKAGVSGDG